MLLGRTTVDEGFVLSGPGILHLCNKKIEEALSERLPRCDSQSCRIILVKENDFSSKLYC